MSAVYVTLNVRIKIKKNNNNSPHCELGAPVMDIDINKLNCSREKRCRPSWVKAKWYSWSVTSNIPEINHDTVKSHVKGLNNFIRGLGGLINEPGGAYIWEACKRNKKNIPE